MVLRKNLIEVYFKLLPISAISVIGLVCLVTTFQLIQQYAYHIANEFDFTFSWGEIAIKLLIGNLFWAILSPLLLLIGQRVANSKGLLSAWQLGHFTIVMLVAFVQNALSLWFYNLSYYVQSGYMRDFLGSNNRSELITGFFTSLIEGVVIIGIFMAIDYQKKLANKERDLAKAQLAGLKMQLHPHFLFNTLHSISSMIDIDVKKAQRMITKVGDLLRSMLSHNEDEFITLKDEIDFIRNYLELEQIRFQDRMEIDFSIDENVMKSKVPNLILQPLVENCIKHGVARSTGHSKIEVAAALCQNGSKVSWVKLEVNNSDDQELRSYGSGGFGIGLSNVEKRLAQSYGEQYYCHFEKLDSHCYKSEIRVPLELKND